MNDLNVFNGNNQRQEMSVASAATAIAATKQAQEVQARMVVAKKFPRDEAAAMNRILKSCQRTTLAESAMYSYPRGGQEVTGPSIRLAECLAQNWGNIEFGYTELERKQGESTILPSLRQTCRTSCGRLRLHLEGADPPGHFRGLRAGHHPRGRDRCRNPAVRDHAERWSDEQRRLT